MVIRYESKLEKRNNLWGVYVRPLNVEHSWIQIASCDDKDRLEEIASWWSGREFIRDHRKV
jgi:hypothetical protein